MESELSKLIFEKINVTKCGIPNDYHCDCHYCAKFRGILKRKDGSYYNRNDRRKYYSRAELASTTENHAGHIAKTPLHIARWAIDSFSVQNEVILDPTAGAGTSLVEAMWRRRQGIGIELEFSSVTRENIRNATELGANGKSICIKGDARNMLRLLSKKIKPGGVDLVVNNPPYSGDQSQKAIGGGLYDYINDKNLGLLSEGDEYFETLFKIYNDCRELLRHKGHIVIGVKDMVKNKQPFFLHKELGSLFQPRLWTYKGMWLLPHHPTTLFINTYNKRFPDVKVPRYQTILVFQKR